MTSSDTESPVPLGEVCVRAALDPTSVTGADAVLESVIPLNPGRPVAGPPARPPAGAVAPVPDPGARR
ncbi:hypothetical protein [Plantactinospora sp. KBS50]|uniref:hypothetical protein n=1 Tax=Plantactinospora sp. KBS50 TaxID=2024580 RepID=UPI000BAA9A13|nr:hypothetical protein [Plantactinospora sp. KBS50]ASW55333.1 hypothetical protein CIK06_15875 [Plantactinospora sp. KBS50]